MQRGHWGYVGWSLLKALISVTLSVCLPAWHGRCYMLYCSINRWQSYLCFQVAMKWPQWSNTLFLWPHWIWLELSLSSKRHLPVRPLLIEHGVFIQSRHSIYIVNFWCFCLLHGEEHWGFKFFTLYISVNLCCLLLWALQSHEVCVLCLTFVSCHLCGCLLGDLFHLSPFSISILFSCGPSGVVCFTNLPYLETGVYHPTEILRCSLQPTHKLLLRNCVFHFTLKIHIFAYILATI